MQLLHRTVGSRIEGCARSVVAVSWVLLEIACCSSVQTSACIILPISGHGLVVTLHFSCFYWLCTAQCRDRAQLALLLNVTQNRVCKGAACLHIRPQAAAKAQTLLKCMRVVILILQDAQAARALYLP